MKFSQFLTEARKKEHRVVFKETDGRSPFPNDTITSLEKEINKNCKDFDKNWTSAIEILNYSFNELNVPIPKANNLQRWDQYKSLLAYSVKNLYDACGMKGGWTASV